MPRANDERIGKEVRMSRDLHDRLTKAAEERNLSANYLVVAALEDFLSRLIPVEEFKLTRDP